MSQVYFIKRDFYYSYKEADTVEMCIIGSFLTSDVGSGLDSSYQDWFYNDTHEVGGGNATNLEKDGDFILLTDEYPVEKFAHIVVTMRRAQFIKLLNDWKEIVCKNRPQELILRYENDEYTLEVIKA